MPIIPDSITVNDTQYIKKPSAIAYEQQIVLKAKEISAISETVGGKTLRTADDIVKLFQQNFRIKVGGAEYDITSEDAQALKDLYTGFGFMPFDDFVKNIVDDALSLYLWGSTRGTIAFR